MEVDVHSSQFSVLSQGLKPHSLQLWAAPLASLRENFAFEGWGRDAPTQPAGRRRYVLVIRSFYEPLPIQLVLH